MNPPGRPITLALDRPQRPYTLRWTRRAEALNSSLPRPVSFADLRRGRRSFYALCAIVWAAIEERDHDFTGPEDLAELLSDSERQAEAIDAIKRMLDEAFPSKKNAPVTDGSANGPITSPAAPTASTSGA